LSCTHSTFQVGILPLDSDTVTLATSGLDLALVAGAATHGLLGQTDIRYGRLNLQNNFGSELLDLTMPLSAEYYLNAGEEFIVNADDNCTTRAIADVLLYNDQEPKTGRVLGDPTIIVSGASTTTLSSITPFAAGQATMTFDAPGVEGFIEVEVQTPSWLLSDLDNIDNGIQGPGLHCDPSQTGTGQPGDIAGCVADTNSVDDVPLRRGNFGIFRGSDNIIDIREVVP